MSRLKKRIFVFASLSISLLICAISAFAGNSVTEIKNTESGLASSGETSAKYTTGSWVPLHNYKFEAKASGSGTNTAMVYHKAHNDPNGSFKTLKSSGAGTRTATVNGKAGHAMSRSYAEGKSQKDTSTVRIK